MKLLNSSSVLQVSVRQFGKENLALYLKSVDYNGNMSIVNTIIIKLLCHFFRLVDIFGKTFSLNGTTINS